MNWTDIFRTGNDSVPQLAIATRDQPQLPSSPADDPAYQSLLQQQAQEREDLQQDFERMRRETIANPEYQALIKKYPTESAEFLAEPEGKVPAELIVFDALREYDQQQEEWRRWQKDTLYWLAPGKHDEAN